MKKVIYILIFISGIAFGQDYAPFNQDVPKRFFEVTDTSSNDFYFYSLKQDVLADGIRFNQYFRRTELEVSYDEEQCGDWGVGIGSAADTTWLGREIVYTTATKTLMLKNEFDEPLIFHFSLELGDSALFYSDASNEFYIKHTSLTPEVVYGTTDNVKTFTVFHYDIGGVAVPSDINGFEIKIGETLGLLSFVNCKKFPIQEKAYALMGQLHPTIGKYQMTYDEAFPWEMGDVLQYKSSYINPEYGVSNTTYRTLNITERVEIGDTVFIYFESDEFTLYHPNEESFPFTALFGYSNPISFIKGTNITAEPSGMMPFINDYNRSDSVSYCGMRERLRFIPDWQIYCDSCQCDITPDGYGMDLFFRTFTAGLGITYRKTESFESPWSPFTYTTLNYSKINDIQCGGQIFAGNESITLEYQLYPNPTLDQLNIVLKYPINSIRIFDLNGALIFETFTAGATIFEIDVATFSAGMYLIEFVSDDDNSFAKFVKN